MPIFIFSNKYRENTNEFLKNTGEPMPKFSIFAEYDMNTGKEQVRVTKTHKNSDISEKCSKKSAH